MENTDALDLSKENIQPLKKGRNTTQLGLALQAQTDVQLQQILQKKQEWYEMQIRTYEGDDPLGLWYDYISWVEQSYPKHGLEGSLGVLLPKCFQTFKDEERYKQDLRFVRLWIKYIEMQNDSRRTELYKLLLSQGIGSTSAEFYQSWAYEYEVLNDFKLADAIYQLGFKNMAQPAADLQAAYNRFQVTVAQYVLHRESDPAEESPENLLQLDQRLPMSSLKAVGKKAVAPVVRVGGNVRSSVPGTLQSNNNGPSSRPGPSRPISLRGNNAGPISIYQERTDVEVDVLGGTQLPRSGSVVPQTLNKENSLKAGPWTTQGLGSRKHQGTSSSSSAHLSYPRNPGFEVHKDEDADIGCRPDLRIHGLQTPNALKTRKTVEDGFQGAMSIFEDPDPNSKPMYRKNQVYAGGMEFQLEELHAMDYFRALKSTKSQAVSMFKQAQGQELRQSQSQELFFRQGTESVNQVFGQVQEHLHGQGGQQETLQHESEERELLRRQAEERELLRRQAEEQEHLRRQAEEQEHLRRQAEEQEHLRRQAEEQEHLRRQAEEQERLRRQAEEQEQLRRQAEEQELLCLQAEKEKLLHCQAEEQELLCRQFQEQERVHQLVKEQELSCLQVEKQELVRRRVKEQELLRRQAEGQDLPLRNSDQHLQSTPKHLAHHQQPMLTEHGIISHNLHQSPAIGVYGGYLAPQSSTSLSSNVSDHGSCPSSVERPQQSQLRQTQRPTNQSMYNQSMTVHTKLAMNEMAGLWESPSDPKSADTSRGDYLSVPLGEKQTFPICQDQTVAMPLTALPQRDAFEICRDDASSSCQNSAEGNVRSQRKLAPFLEECEQMDTNSLPPIRPSVTSPPDFLFGDPLTLTTYQRSLAQFSVYREEEYHSPTSRGKFDVFSDDAEVNSASLRTPKNSSPAKTSLDNIAKEKENLHKFPIADMELMEECGVTPVEDPSVYQYQQHTQPQFVGGQNMLHPVEPLSMQRHDMENLHIHLANPPLQTPSSPLVQQCEEKSQVSSHASPKSASPHHNFENVQCAAGSVPRVQEPMDDDATVAAPAHHSDLSETCNTQAFFFPGMTSSTPFASRVSHLEHAGKIKYNQQDSNGSPSSQEPQEEPTRTVPPLRLYRVRDSHAPNDQHLSTILESSKEKYTSLLSSGSSRSSSSSGSRYTIYTTSQRLSAVSRDSITSSSTQEPEPQAKLSLIQESSESSAQEAKSDPEPVSELALQLQRGYVNPFDTRLIEDLLLQMGFPQQHHRDGYFVLNTSVPAKRQNNLVLNGETYNIPKVLGEGAYAKVLKGVHIQTQREVALKIQKPSWQWEYYICREIQRRLTNRQLATAFMQAEKIYLYNNGSVILTDLVPFGTLLTLVNKVVATTKRQMLETQVCFLVDQLLSAVAALHSCKIIHGDLKPDNVLLRTIPNLQSDTPCIQLIDFGRSIDMTLLPDGISFSEVVKTDCFTCIEMQTGRPWTYQTDLYGLANTAHCLLRGEYMRVQEDRISGRWTFQSRLPRQLNKDLWHTFFDTLLNIESCESMPDLETIRADVQAAMHQHSCLQSDLRNLGQVMMER